MTELNVVLHYDCGPEFTARLQALATDGLRVETCSEGDDERFAQLISEADVLWHVLRPVTADSIARARRLRLIQKIGVGVNTIDLAAARGRSIPVCNMPGTNSQAVAEMALLLMLTALRRTVHFDRKTRAGRGWEVDPVLMDRLGEIRGRRIGLIGFGAVPSLLAPWLTAMGAEVIYWARPKRDDIDYRFVSLDELLSTSDIVSLHVPLIDETAHIIDRPALMRMKPGATLINTARGGLVDEAALVEALSSGRLASAGLDVFAEEPVRDDNPLLALDNVTLTPHIAWITPATLERSLVVAVENCQRLVSGRPLLNRVA